MELNPEETQNIKPAEPMPPKEVIGTPLTPQIPVGTPPIPKAEPVHFAGIPLPPVLERLLPLLLAVFAIFLGILVFGVVQKFIEKPEPKPMTIIVTPTPSPTPIRNRTTIATTSAFTQFEANIASLSGKVNAFQESDPSLSPPSLVLPLGFP
jgi:hypothetical protein